MRALRRCHSGALQVIYEVPAIVKLEVRMSAGGYSTSSAGVMQRGPGSVRLTPPQVSMATASMALVAQPSRHHIPHRGGAGAVTLLAPPSETAVGGLTAHRIGAQCSTPTPVRREFDRHARERRRRILGRWLMTWGCTNPSLRPRGQEGGRRGRCDRAATPRCGRAWSRTGHLFGRVPMVRMRPGGSIRMAAVPQEAMT
jgi:hypothetical protein